jgi:hypothetical protein
MTARDVLNKHVRRAQLLSLSGLLIIIGSLGTMNNQRASLSVDNDFLFMSMVGVLVVGAALVVVGQILFFAVRCPSCRGKLGLLVHRKFSFDHVKFCLHCGMRLDDELTGPGKPMKVGAEKAGTWSDEFA